MEININKDIREYTEGVFFGLNLRQLICSGLAVGSAVAVAAITMSSAALSKYIFSSFGAGDMFKAVSPSARSVTKTILKDAALAAVTVGAIDTYRYSKYGKIRTKKSKENKGA